MKVPHGATHRNTATGEFYIFQQATGFHRIIDEGVSVSEPSTLDRTELLKLVIVLEEPRTLQERLTAILGVETNEDIVTHVKALHDVAQEQEGMYWDGVEPLRVGHIVEQGEIVARGLTMGSLVKYGYSDPFMQKLDTLTPHPLNSLSDSERELVNNLIEAGVVCLPS